MIFTRLGRLSCMRETLWALRFVILEQELLYAFRLRNDQRDS